MPLTTEEEIRLEKLKKLKALRQEVEPEKAKEPTPIYDEAEIEKVQAIQEMYRPLMERADLPSELLQKVKVLTDKRLPVVGPRGYPDFLALAHNIAQGVRGFGIDIATMGLQQLEEPFFLKKAETFAPPLPTGKEITERVGKGEIVETALETATPLFFRTGQPVQKPIPSLFGKAEPLEGIKPIPTKAPSKIFGAEEMKQAKEVKEILQAKSTAEVLKPFELQEEVIEKPPAKQGLLPTIDKQIIEGEFGKPLKKVEGTAKIKEELTGQKEPPVLPGQKKLFEKPVEPPQGAMIGGYGKSGHDSFVYLDKGWKTRPAKTPVSPELSEKLTRDYLRLKELSGKPFEKEVKPRKEIFYKEKFSNFHLRQLSETFMAANSEIIYGREPNVASVLDILGREANFTKMQAEKQLGRKITTKEYIPIAIKKLGVNLIKEGRNRVATLGETLSGIEKYGWENPFKEAETFELTQEGIIKEGRWKGYTPEFVREATFYSEKPQVPMGYEQLGAGISPEQLKLQQTEIIEAPRIVKEGKATIRISNPERDFSLIDKVFSPSEQYAKVDPALGQIADLGRKAYRDIRTLEENLLNEFNQDVLSRLSRKSQKDFGVHAKKGITAETPPDIAKVLPKYAEIKERIRKDIIQTRKDAGLETPDDWGLSNTPTSGAHFAQIHEGNWGVFLREGEKLKLIGDGIQPNKFKALDKALNYVRENPETVEFMEIKLMDRNFGDLVTRLPRKAYFALRSRLEGYFDASAEEVMEAFAQRLGIKPKRTRFFRFGQQRKMDLEGWTADVAQEIQTYVNGYARWKYISEFNRKSSALFDQIPFDKKGARSEAESYMDAINGRQTKTSILYENLLRNLPLARDFVKPFPLERHARLISQVVANFTLTKPATWTAQFLQPMQTLYPLIGERGIIKAFTDAVLSHKMGTPQYEMIRQTGIGFQPSALQEGAGAFVRVRIGFRKLANKLTPLQVFSYLGRNNRRIGFFGGIFDGQRKGLTGQALMDNAIKFSERTEFVNDISDIAPIFRNPAIRTWFQFKPFMFKYGERVMKLRGAQWGRFLMANVLIGGLKLPMRPIAWLTGFGLYELYNDIEKKFGKETADVINYGLPSLLGIDLTGNLSFQLAWGRDAKEQLANMVLGTPGSLVYNTLSSEGVKGKLGQLPLTDQLIDIMNWVSGEERVTTRKGLLQYKTTPEERAVRGLGFKPIREGKIQDLSSALFKESQRRQEAKEDLKKAFRKGEMDKVADFIIKENITDQELTSLLTGELKGQEIPSIIRQLLTQPDATKAKYLKRALELLK